MQGVLLAGRFRIGDRLGAGGVGRVWSAARPPRRPARSRPRRVRSGWPRRPRPSRTYSRRRRRTPGRSRTPPPSRPSGSAATHRSTPRSTARRRSSCRRRPTGCVPRPFGCAPTRWPRARIFAGRLVRMPAATPRRCSALR
ncbi:hypothetical protein F9278_29540 [Streptomyces phaeolivaceus]|uniref:Uncharacterized protein n=1 Tax=Streptomyces phaeolivaceus TaxID=2653200 RepID=A0A5P8K9B3_9ACTN|nr:hypothetical protein F9278_29540 [Streptomyces phaeolivaceus]